MTKDKFLDDLITAGSIIGGAWLVSELIKNLGKPIYQCSYCKKIIDENSLVCPNCGTRAKW